MLKYHIQTIEVGSGGTTSISFNNIPQTYDDLYLTYSARSGGTDNNNGNYSIFGLQFNSSTSNYSAIELSGNGSAVQSLNRTTTTIGGTTYARFNNGIKNSYNSNTTFENGQILIAKYAGSKNKSYSVDSVGEQNAGDAIQNISAGFWADTSAIMSINLATVGDFVQYSSFSLYGIKHGTSGEVEVASGGEISYSGGYTIHTFNSSGTFVANRDMDVEYLVIGGGGAGAGGGGGAGGYRCSVSGESSGGGASAESTFSVSASNSYSVIVGAGASAGSWVNNATNGNASSFANVLSLGGGGGGGNSIAPPTGGGSGGGALVQSSDGTTVNGAAGTANQGYAGGSGTDIGSSPNYFGSGGGGGAGGIGTNGSTNISAATSIGGNGGAGLASLITGTSIYRAGGGGGCNEGNTTGGQGGSGVGGNGRIISTAAQSGTVNTGSGGGGTTATGNGGNGGSGVVIIRYLTP